MIEKSGKHYLYRHIRLDTGEPFYVGIGTKKNKKFKFYNQEYERAYCKGQRNRHWNSIVNKTNYEVEILLESDDYEFIKQKETEFITLYKRVKDGGKLCNLTLGGQGTKGVQHFGKNNPNYGNKMTPEQSKLMMSARGDINGENNPNCKEVICTKTLNIYPFAKIVAKKENIKYSTFKNMLNGNSWNKTYYMYLKDYNSGLKINEKTKAQKPKPDKLYINTNTKEIYKSYDDVKNKTGLSKSRIWKILSGKEDNDIKLMYLSEYIKENPHFKPQ